MTTIELFGSGTSSDFDAFDPAEGEPVRVTVVIPTLDEAHQIEEALDRLRWADEVIVADGGSTDLTRQLARTAGATVMELPGLTIGGQRNAAIAAARNEWILALDADERITDALVEELRKTLADPVFDAYRIRLRNFYLGREVRHGHWGRDWHVRLFRRQYSYSATRVHERLRAPREIGTLKSNIVHRPYRDLAHHLEKIVRYSRWGADDLYRRGRRAGVRELTLRPAWRFFREFVVYRGFRDGTAGLILSGLSATAAFLKYAFLFAQVQRPRDA